MAITKWSRQGRLTKEEQAESHSDARGNKMSANDCIFDREEASERARENWLAENYEAFDGGSTQILVFHSVTRYASAETQPRKRNMARSAADGHDDKRRTTLGGGRLAVD